MANIPNIQYQTDAISTVPGTARVRATSSDFGAGTEKGAAGLLTLGAGIDKVGEALYKRDEQEDLSNLHVTTANLLASSIRQAKDRAAKGEATGADFTENVLNEFDQTSDKLAAVATTREGQNYLQRTVAEIRAHVGGTAADLQRSARSDKAANDINTSFNALAGTTKDNPNSFGTALQMLNSQIENSVKMYGLDAEKGDDLRRVMSNELATSAMRGWIGKDINYAKKLLSDGVLDKFLTPNRQQELVHEIKTEVKMQEAEARQKRALALAEHHEAQQANLGVAVAALFDHKLGWRDNQVKLAEMDLDPHAKLQMGKLVEAQSTGDDSNPLNKTSPENFMKVWKVISGQDPTAPPVTENDLNRMLGVTVGRDFYPFFKAHLDVQKSAENEMLKTMEKTATSAIQGIAGPADKSWQEGMLRFINWYRPEYERLKALGGKAADLTSPDGPILKSAALFKPSLIRQVQAKFGEYNLANARLQAFHNKHPAAELDNPEPALTPEQAMEKAASETLFPLRALGKAVKTAAEFFTDTSGGDFGGAGEINPERSRKKGESQADFLKRVGGGK